MDAIGYCRLSAAEPGGNSIPNQKKRVEDYCQHNNLNLLQIFVDDGKTGWNFDRPGFIKMEQFCKANKNVQYLIIPHFDRFSRADPVDAMMKERYLREKLGVKVLQISEPIDTDTTSSNYQIIRFMQAFAANEERNRIVDRTRAGIVYSLNTGRYCNKPPYGYQRGHDANGKPIIIIDEYKAPVVKMIFREYLKGRSVEDIRKSATNLGFNVKGNSAIQKILNNSLYGGLVKVPAYRTNPEKLVKGTHQALITETQYWQTQELLGGKNYASHPSEDAILRGVLTCHCGRKMTAAPSKGKSGRLYWYYFCKEHRKNNLSAVKLHDQLYEMLETMSLDNETIELIKKQLADQLNEELATKGKNIMQTRHQLGKVTGQIETIEERYLLQPDISPAVYKKTMAAKKVEQARLQNELNQLEQDNSVYWKRLTEEVLPALNNLGNIFKNLPIHKQHALLKAVFEQFLTYSSGSYRTPSISFLFADKELILKQKGLLLVEQPFDDLSLVTQCRHKGSQFEHLMKIAAILVA